MRENLIKLDIFDLRNMKRKTRYFWKQSKLRKSKYIFRSGLLRIRIK